LTNFGQPKQILTDLMANNYFRFKQFTIYHDRCAFKVGTDGVLLGASADLNGAARILDIGTGSGLIALMVAQRCDAAIIAIEPDDGSFNQACENFKSSPWGNRIEGLYTDLQGFHPGDLKFDLIVSNPPYFSNSLKNPDPRKSAARHNDSLTPGEMLEGVTHLLTEGGKLQVIMPYAEGTIFIAEAQEYGLFCNSILKIRPLPTSEVRRLILTFSKQRMKLTERFLTIEHGKRHEFTEEYMNLTRDFYLKFT
jgi:tRNA1Val (adenine37-N6)-methyltransferase